MKNSAKNLIVLSVVVVSCSVFLYLIMLQENRIVHFWERGKYLADSVYISPGDREEARQFSDSILPALKKNGLVITVTLNAIESTVIVSDSLWNDRTAFFKENFLNRAAMYNRVNGFTSPVIIVSQLSGQPLARTTPPVKYDLY